MEAFLLEERYTKGQLIEGLYAYFSGYKKYLTNNETTAAIFPEHSKAPKSFSAKIKKLLDLDRALNKGDYVFFNQEGVGQGGLEHFNDYQVVLMGFAVDSLYKGFKQSEVLWVTKRVKDEMWHTLLMVHRDKKKLIKEYGASCDKGDLYSTARFYRAKLNTFIYLIINNFEISSPEIHEDLRRIRYEFLHTSNLDHLLARLDTSTSCVIFDFINLSLVAPQVVQETPIPLRGRPSKS